MQRRSKVRVTYLLTSVASDRVGAALQIIHQSRSIIVEATGSRATEACTLVSTLALSQSCLHKSGAAGGNVEAERLRTLSPFSPLTPGGPTAP